MYSGLWWGNLKDGDHLEDSDIDGIIILKWILEKWAGGMDWIIWLRIGTGGGFL